MRSLPCVQTQPHTVFQRLSWCMAWKAAQAAHWEAQSESDREEQLVDPSTGRYVTTDAWHEGLDVQRGQAPARLALNSGFLRQIVSPRPAYQRVAEHTRTAL